MSVEDIITKIQKYIKDEHDFDLTEGDIVTPKDDDIRKTIFDNTPLYDDIINLITQYVDVSPLILSDKEINVMTYGKKFLRNIDNVIWQYFQDSYVYDFDDEEIPEKEIYVYKQDNIEYPYVIYIRTILSRYHKEHSYIKIPNDVVNLT